MHVLIPILDKMGVSVRMALDRLGWYPVGNGAVTVEIEPAQELLGLQLEDRGELKAVRGLSISSKLPMGVSKRQRRRADEMLTQAGFDAHIRMVDVPASCPGTIFFLWAEFEKSWAGFGSLGRRGKPAEVVAEEAVGEFLRLMESGAAVDEHLADQLIIYMALAKGLSVLTTPNITPHLTTSIWVVEQFLPVKFEVEGNEGGKGKVSRIR
jgi:RNA 3'-terminal phosphate cyclase (ATP)